jgi:hypothetical protein
MTAFNNNQYNIKFQTHIVSQHRVMYM